MLKSAVIWGASGHAKVLHEFIGRLGYQLVATFDNNPRVVPPFPGVPLFSGKEGFEKWRANNAGLAVAGLVAIGGARGKDRLLIQQFLAEQGVAPIQAVHPTAFVADSTRLGRGCHVLAKAVVGVKTHLGDACIVNTAASVDHECVLGRGVHIAPGSTLAGCVEVGDFSLIAVGAVVLPHMKIGRNCIVGAGAVVTRNVPDDSVVYGNPARVMRASSND